MNIKTYLIAFILFSFLGWVFEFIFFDQVHSVNLSEQIIGIRLPFLYAYGVCGVILLLIYNLLDSYPLLVKIIIASIIINMTECGIGLVSHKFYGYQTWKYDHNMIPLCHGYISLITGFGWTILIGIFYYILDKLYHK